jgi:beta-lactam-binding protein with PASTA domain
LPLTLTKVILIGVGLTLTAGVSAFITMRFTLAAQEVSVPELVGRRTAEAEQMAARRGLYIKVEGSRYDPEIERDHIVTQVPAAATMLKSHRSIKVWISRGRRQRTVPSLEGTSVRTARLTLDQAGVPLQRVIEVDDFVRDGIIIVQNPPAGETEDVGDGVSLVVSRGPVTYARIMPDLIGLAADQVLAQLRNTGLKVADIRYRTYPGVASGTVLRQTPLAGHPISPRSSVSLEVSAAPR